MAYLFRPSLVFFHECFNVYFIQILCIFSLFLGMFYFFVLVNEVFSFIMSCNWSLGLYIGRILISVCIYFHPTILLMGPKFSVGFLWFSRYRRETFKKLSPGRRSMFPSRALLFICLWVIIFR